MARSVARVKVTIWKSADWKALPALAQWLYSTVLLTQGDLTLAGKLPYAPKRWAALAGEMDEATVEHYAGVLERANYIVVDRDTDECVIRTFTIHDLADGNLNKNLVKGFWSAWDGILSADLRHLVVLALPDRVWSWEGAEIPDEAKRFRTSPRLEPTVETNSPDCPPEPPRSSPVTSTAPAAEPVVTVAEKLTAAATILATAEAERRGTEIGNFGGYVASRVAPIERQNADRWTALLNADPSMTAEQLAAPPVVAEKRPAWVKAEESTAAASEARYRLEERIRAGEVCDECRGTGEYLPIGAKDVAPCPCRVAS